MLAVGSDPSLGRILFLLILSSLPIFIAGVIEDLTKRIGPAVQLVTTLLSAYFSVFYFDLQVNRFDVPVIDDVAARLSFFGACSAVFAIA